MIIAPVAPSSLFVVHGTHFIAEDSDLRGRGINVLARAYDDACDQGFQIRSERTGRQVLFTLVRTEKDEEGDVVAWHFESSRVALYTSVVFND